jgi:AmmeMemoRadiSam system protein B
LTSIRSPAVAGLFYPDDPGELSAAVRGFLGEASPAQEGAAKAVIAPHAGYVYSGIVAAHAYASLAPAASRAKRVVVIGPAHRVAFEGIALPAAEAFDTPLGRMVIDPVVCAEVIARGFATAWDLPHADEHAIEVQLPFLQHVLGDVMLVPLVVGDAAPEQVASLLDAVWGGDETRIVVSSDLSHYLSYDQARRRDVLTAEAIEAADPSALGPEDACGFLPIAGLLRVARRRSLKALRLDLRNSGDTAGPRGSVVGYGAWAFAWTRSRQSSFIPDALTTSDHFAISAPISR